MKFVQHPINLNPDSRFHLSVISVIQSFNHYVSLGVEWRAAEISACDPTVARSLWFDISLSALWHEMRCPKINMYFTKQTRNIIFNSLLVPKCAMSQTVHFNEYKQGNRIQPHERKRKKEPQKMRSTRTFYQKKNKYITCEI